MLTTEPRPLCVVMSEHDIFSMFCSLFGDEHQNSKRLRHSLWASLKADLCAGGIKIDGQHVSVCTPRFYLWMLYLHSRKIKKKKENTVALTGTFWFYVKALQNNPQQLFTGKTNSIESSSWIPWNLWFRYILFHEWTNFLRSAGTNFLILAGSAFYQIW